MLAIIVLVPASHMALETQSFPLGPRGGVGVNWNGTGDIL